MNVPSKRQPSKQRRAAQNRATRAQREVRSQRAGELQASAPERSEPASDETVDSSSESPIGGSGSAFSTMLGGLFGGGGGAGGGRPRPPRPQPTPQPVSGKGLAATRPDGTRLPGALAAVIAVGLAAVALLTMLFLPLASVDDRGEPLPDSFRGLYLEAREFDQEDPPDEDPVEADSVTYIEAGAALALVAGVIALGLTVYAWWMHRKTGLSRPLTIGMVALAIVLFFGAGQLFLAALIALAVGSFQARKAELPARMAERAERVGARNARNGDDVIDVDAVEEDVDDDEYVDEDEYDEDLDVDDELDEYDEEDEYLDEDEEDEYEDEDEYDEELEGEEDVEDEDVDEDEEDEYDEEPGDEAAEDVAEDEDEDVKR